MIKGGKLEKKNTTQQQQNLMKQDIEAIIQ